MKKLNSPSFSLVGALANEKALGLSSSSTFKVPYCPACELRTSPLSSLTVNKKVSSVKFSCEVITAFFIFTLLF